MIAINRNKKEYSPASLVFGNLAIVIWELLGTVTVWSINRVTALVFFIAVTGLVYGLLRKRCCKTCYYCKTCTVGFGKLPELFFRKNGIENIDVSGVKMFPLVYAAVGVIPVVTATFSIIQEFTMIKGIVLGLLVTVTVYVGIVRRELLNKRFS